VSTRSEATEAIQGLDDSTSDSVERAAVLGGSPAVRRPFPRWPQSGELEKRLLHEVVESGQWWRMTGSQVKAFEAAFAAHHGVRLAFAVTNGTHALELALRALDIGPGDEVVIPSLTFVATAMAVFTMGARPIPVDVAPDTWCMSQEAMAEAFTPRTKAVIPVHFAGHMADMPALTSVCEQHGIPVIEDAAHAHGASWEGRPAGSFGQMSGFSFQNFKLLTAGEGGMLLSTDEKLFDRSVLIANCGRPVGDTRYEHSLLGSNYRMSEFQGAILNAQLTRLEDQGRMREHNAAYLGQRLGSIPGIHPQIRDARMTRHSYYMYVFTYDPAAFAGMDRATFVAALAAEGVPAFRMYPRVQDTTHFAPALVRNGGEPRNLPPSPVSLDLADRGVWLHHRALLGGEEETEQIVSAIEKIRREARQIAKCPVH